MNRHDDASNTLNNNPVMFQAFEWYLHSDQDFWRRLKTEVPKLKALGIDAIWIPPACKAGSRSSNGYDIYDLYDTGEFDQKGSVATKWGTKHELLDLTTECSRQGIKVYVDAVLNHKAYADYVEQSQAVEVNAKGESFV